MSWKWMDIVHESLVFKDKKFLYTVTPFIKVSKWEDHRLNYLSNTGIESFT